MSGLAASATSSTPPTRLHDEPRDVGGDEHAPAVAAVGDDAAGEREDEEGHELRGDHEPDRLDAAAGLEHGERQRHEHDAVADERQHLPGEQQPELRLGAQHLRDERANPPHRARAYGTLSSPSPSQATCPSRARAAGSRDGTCRCSSRPTRSWSSGCGGARAGSARSTTSPGCSTSLGRVTGLLGAYLALVELLLLARIPVLDAVGLERMARWHRVQRHRVPGAARRPHRAHHGRLRAGRRRLAAPRDRRPAHALLGRAAGDRRRSACSWSSSSPRSWPSRRRLSYRVVARAARQRVPRDRARRSATSSPPATSSRASRSPAPTGGRSTPSTVARARRPADRAPGRPLAAPPPAHRARRARGAGRRLGRDRRRRASTGCRVRAGQSLHWRFLARGHWWETHPFSLSAAPDGRRLRITVKDVGDYTRRLASLPPGTRVIVEGPVGRADERGAPARRGSRSSRAAWASRRSARCSRTPRASRATIAVIYRAASEDDVLFRDELDELARRRGAELHYVLGERRGDELLSAEHLQALVPDIAGRDVYVCGPPSDDRGHAREPAPRRASRRARSSARGSAGDRGGARAARRARRGRDGGGRRAAGQRPRAPAVDRRRRPTRADAAADQRDDEPRCGA